MTEQTTQEAQELYMLAEDVGDVLQRIEQVLGIQFADDLLYTGIKVRDIADIAI